LIRALRLDNRWVRWALAAAAVIAFFLFRDRLPDIDLEEIVKDLSRGLGSWTYLLVAALAFLETGAFVGLVAPGEFTVMLGGAVAGQGDISLPLILGITWLSAFLGDSVSFMLGAKLGRGFLVRHGARFQITDERLHQVERYFDRHGGKTIFIGRFIGLVRALAPFIAGSSRMRYSAFAPYSILGTGLWSAVFILIGYFASQSLGTVTEIVSRGLVYFGVFVGAVVGLIVLYRYLRERENREQLAAAMERRRALRPVLALARRVRPQALFLWHRVTPGGLGLELTTLLAALAVGLFVLISYWSIVSGDPGPTGGDRTALDLFNDIRTGWLNDVADTVTDLGSAYIVFPLAGLAGVALAATRRWTELGVLIAGMVLIVIFTHEIKDWTDRPRPADGLVPADGSAFPSAHAAYATIYTWLAATIAFRIVPGITRRSLVIVVGIALTALVGISRGYLRVHWLSDVLGGWALGVSCFAGAAAVALIFVHIRNNLRRDARPPDPRPRAPAGARQ
jgi:membrane protein DedA with SNARE-associated domain/membrane-associated phospholipid phosphatase